jgi:hypothetical protein
LINSKQTNQHKTAPTHPPTHTQPTNHSNQTKTQQIQTKKSKVAVATAEIDARGRPRHEVQRAIKAKEKAREALARRYRTASLSEEDLLWALYSVADNNTYLAFNR